MGLRTWWNRRRGARPSASDELDPLAPATKLGTLRVSEGLRIHEYAHACHGKDGLIAARTFVTDGLSARGALEVRATVPRDWSDPEVDAVRQTLALQEGLAADGKPAVLGGFTGFRTPGLAGGAPIAVVYARPMPVAGIPASGAALVMVPLHPDELEIVQRGLAIRVLGLLALRARVFPYPPCWEIRTEPVLTREQQALSFLDQVGYSVMGEVRVTIETAPERPDAETLVLSLPPSAAAAFARRFRERPDSDALVLAAHLAPGADGQRVWVPGSTTPHATTSSAGMPRRMGCGFLALAARAGGDELKHIEDGAALMLSEPVFAQVREALVSGDDRTLHVNDVLTVLIEHRRAALVDPFTGQSIAVTGGWERFRPDAPAANSGPVAVEQIVLLVSEEELAARIDTDTLAAAIGDAQAIVERLAAEYPVEHAVAVAIGLTFTPDQSPRVQLAYSDGAEPALLGPLHDALAAMAPIRVRGEIAFRIELQVLPLGN